MKRNLSIRGLTGKYLVLVLLVSLLGLLVLAGVAWHSINEDIERHQRFEISVLQRQFSEVLGFYQGIAERLSRKAEVVEILEFGDKERAVTWASEVRELVPESIGVALIDPEGEILGEPLQLNLGTQCVSDLHAHFSGKLVGSPPVHRANPRLAHFDVIHEVKREGEILGILFISFSLDVIQRRIDQVTGMEQILMVVDSAGQPIATKGSAHPHAHHWGRQHQVAIDGTDWMLFYRKDQRGASGFLIFTLAIAAVLILVTIGVMLLLSLRLVGLFKNDLGFIKDQLSGVYAGDSADAVQSKTMLSETSEIMRDVGELMDNIKRANMQLKELSINDELSGLFNRRGFDGQLKLDWELSARGVNSFLVFIDIDHFKQVNDRFGHGVGDEVIIAFAQALREHCRKTDITARLGGDEFAVILNSFEQQQGIESWYYQLAEGFQQRLEQMAAGSEPISCSISAGAVLLDKGRYGSVQEQMRAADRALYRAKEQGRARIVCDFP